MLSVLAFSSIDILSLSLYPIDASKNNEFSSLANPSRKRKRRELIPYSELPTKRHRLQHLQKELEYIAGQHHSKEDEENILRALIQIRELKTITPLH
jgi:hypothetical protein